MTDIDKTEEQDDDMMIIEDSTSLKTHTGKSAKSETESPRRSIRQITSTVQAGPRKSTVPVNTQHNARTSIYAQATMSGPGRQVGRPRIIPEQYADTYFEESYDQEIHPSRLDSSTRDVSELPLSQDNLVLAGTEPLNIAPIENDIAMEPGDEVVPYNTPRRNQMACMNGKDSAGDDGDNKDDNIVAT